MMMLMMIDERLEWVILPADEVSMWGYIVCRVCSRSPHFIARFEASGCLENRSTDLEQTNAVQGEFALV